MRNKNIMRYKILSRSDNEYFDITFKTRKEAKDYILNEFYQITYIANDIAPYINEKMLLKNLLIDYYIEKVEN